MCPRHHNGRIIGIVYPSDVFPRLCKTWLEEDAAG